MDLETTAPAARPRSAVEHARDLEVLIPPHWIMGQIFCTRRSAATTIVDDAIAKDTIHFRFKNGLSAKEECAVCLKIFEYNQDIRVLPCHPLHRFHEKCITKWLLEVKANCPVCRQYLPTLKLFTQ